VEASLETQHERKNKMTNDPYGNPTYGEMLIVYKLIKKPSLAFDVFHTVKNTEELLAECLAADFDEATKRGGEVLGRYTKLRAACLELSRLIKEVEQRA